MHGRRGRGRAPALDDPGLVARAPRTTLLSYHATLVADEPRTRAFHAAIEKVVRPGMRVLDVGTGTGVLALHAARLGAEVVAVEVSAMIDYARAMARANGLRLDLRNADIRQIPDTEIEPVDVIVSEMIGNILLDEEIIPILSSARRFLKPGGVVIPGRGRFIVSLASSATIREAAAFWRAPRYDLDWTPLADCVDHDPQLDLRREAALLGPGAALPWIAWEGPAAAIEDRHDAGVELVADRDGVVNAVLVWWEAELHGGIALSLDPAIPWPGEHWFRTLLPVRPRSVAAGDRVAFRLTYDGTQHPDLWSWRLGEESRSSFFAYPPDRERRRRTLK